VLGGHAAYLAYAHRLAAEHCGSQVPAGQAGPLRQLVKFFLPLSLGDELNLAQMLLGLAWVAVGLYVIGIWLENRPNAKRLEVLRVLLNLPASLAGAKMGTVTCSAAALGVLSLGTLLCEPRGQGAGLA
jgi:hypothetical protein